QGQPLELEDLSHIPEDLRLAYKILRNAGCLSPELEARKDINRLLDLLEDCHDEKERLAGMQKIRFLLERSQVKYQRHLRLEQEDPYYQQVLERISKIEKNQN
ncbi:MAG: DUF1992 domain-containing protein, partial [Desulfovibrio sp.]|nr:DUF1992 domain-containing protein [Desulfovibrio sp.]